MGSAEYIEAVFSGKCDMVQIVHWSLAAPPSPRTQKICSLLGLSHKQVLWRILPPTNLKWQYLARQCLPMSSGGFCARLFDATMLKQA